MRRGGLECREFGFPDQSTREERTMPASFTSVDYTSKIDLRLTVEPLNNGFKFLVCEYAEAGAEMPHEVFHSVSWHRTKSAAMNKLRKLGNQYVIVDFSKV